MSSPHLDDDELEEAVDLLVPLVERFGTDGIEEALAAIKSGALDE